MSRETYVIGLFWRKNQKFCYDHVRPFHIYNNLAIIKNTSLPHPPHIIDKFKIHETGKSYFLWLGYGMKSHAGLR